MLAIAVVAFGRHLERPDKFGSFFLPNFNHSNYPNYPNEVDWFSILLDEQGIKL